jgi:ATP-dependent DNA ligase
VQLCAFDVLAMDGEDLRNLPLSKRKTNLDRLLRGRAPMAFSSIRLRSAPLVPIFSWPHAKSGLEGMVSKRSDRPYRGGRSPHWIKVKNRQHHAFERVRESFS